MPQRGAKNGTSVSWCELRFRRRSCVRGAVRRLPPRTGAEKRLETGATIRPIRSTECRFAGAVYSIGGSAGKQSTVTERGSVFPLKDDIPTHRRPVVTVAIIAANVLVYLFQHGGFGSFEASVFALGVTPQDVSSGVDHYPPSLAPPLATIVTSMFAHGGLFHIGGNMLFLWIFGNNVEDDMGPVKFLIFYLLCGVGAAGAQIALDPSSPIPMVGASGAIAGVLGAYLLLYPHARVLALVPIFFFLQLIWVPAVIFLVLWFALQLLGGFTTAAGGGGVAFWAHVGGFVVGVLLVRPFAGRIWRTDEEGGWRTMNPRSRQPWRQQDRFRDFRR